jgi:hypothetical protein
MLFGLIGVQQLARKVQTQTFTNPSNHLLNCAGAAQCNHLRNRPAAAATHSAQSTLLQCAQESVGSTDDVRKAHLQYAQESVGFDK